MGKTARCQHEKMIQKVLPSMVSTRGFQPTSNARNEAMFNEVRQFKQWVITSMKDAQSVQVTIDKFLDNTSAFMHSSLPRVYEEGPNRGQAVPVDVDSQQVGSGVNMEQLQRVPEEMKYLMNLKVVEPMQIWNQRFQDITIQMRDLEALRLEVDSRRRTVDQINLQLTKLRNRQSERAVEDPKMEDKIMVMSDKCRHKEAKSSETLDRYKQMELEVNNSMTELVKDTQQVKQYMGEAMLTLGDGFNTAYGAFSGRLLPSQIPENYNKQEKAAAQKQGPSSIWTAISRSFRRKKANDEENKDKLENDVNGGATPPVHNGTKMSRYEHAEFDHGHEDPDETPNAQGTPRVPAGAVA